MTAKESLNYNHGRLAGFLRSVSLRFQLLSTLEFLVLLFSGFLLIAFGSILLLSSSDLSGGGVFFIFPFFLIGDSSPLNFGLLIALVFAFFIVATSATAMFVSKAESKYAASVPDSFIPVGSRCVHCSRPIPLDSSFCPFCGSNNPQNDQSNESF